MTTSYFIPEGTNVSVVWFNPTGYRASSYELLRPLYFDSSDMVDDLDESQIKNYFSFRHLGGSLRVLRSEVYIKNL